MAKAARGSERREDALSHERIVDAAIELLDAEGENGLTFRALATRLATGSGAIYWHIASKSELLVAASDAVVARAMNAVGARAAPRKTIHDISVAVFDAIDAHPWVGAQLSGPPQTALLLIFERIGRQVQALGVSDNGQFTAASALVSYVIGVSVQNAANRLLCEPNTDRAEFLEMMSARWKELDAHEYPFLRNVATQLREHDDRAEFVAGIDLILGGVESSLRKTPERRPANRRPAKDRATTSKRRSR
jgi:AcrR family transcriptional regulator